MAEELRLDDWARVAAAAPDHPAKQESGGREAAEGRGRAPAPVVALDDRQSDQGQAQSQHQGARKVGQATVELRALAQGFGAEPHHGSSQRQVDEEDEAPVGELNQGTAQGRADRRRGSCCRSPDADARGAALRREGVEDQRQRGRRDHRRAHALDDVEGDQQLERGCSGTEQAGGGKATNAKQEDPLVAEAIGEPAGRHQQRRDDDEVAVEHPGKRVSARTRERARDIREGDVDNRRVEEGKERPRAGDRHDPSMPTVIHRPGL